MTHQIKSTFCNAYGDYLWACDKGRKDEIVAATLGSIGAYTLLNWLKAIAVRLLLPRLLPLLAGVFTVEVTNTLWLGLLAFSVAPVVAWARRRMQ